MSDGCPICGSFELRQVRVFGAYRLWACPGCDGQHWTPLTHPQGAFYENEEVGIYAAKHRGASQHERRYEPFLADFGAVSGKRVLDIGCSDGWLLAEMAARGNQAYGIDIDAKALAIARKRGLTQLSHAPVEDFVREAHARGLSFDIITLFDVLEHTTDPVGVLRDLSSLLAPGGVVAGTVPHRRRLLANLVVTDFPPHHFFRFDAASLGACLARSGLVAQKTEDFEWGYAGLVALAAVRRRVREMMGKPGEARRDTRGDGPSRPTLRARAVRALLAAAGPPTELIERPLGRGFKLYFVANGAASAASAGGQRRPR